MENPIDKKANEIIYDKLRAYVGNNNFINSLRAGVIKYGGLTERQLPHAIKFFNEEKPTQSIQEKAGENNVYPSYVLAKPVFIQLKGQYFVKDLCEQKLELGTLKSYAWLVHEVTGQTDKAIKVKATIPDTTHTLNFCRNCGRKLSDKFSIVTGMGKICANAYGVPYIKDLSQVDLFKAKLNERIAEVGVKEFWLPKYRILESDLLTLLDELNLVKNGVIEKKAEPSMSMAS